MKENLSNSVTKYDTPMDRVFVEKKDPRNLVVWSDKEAKHHTQRQVTPQIVFTI